MTVHTQPMRAQMSPAPGLVASISVRNLTVTYNTTGGWLLTQSHVTASSDAPGGGEWMARKWQNKTGNPAPGMFPHKGVHDPAVTQFSYSIPLSDISGGIAAGDLLHLAAHGVVQSGDTVETAWGEGDPFVTKGNWAMHFTYTVQ